jgi:hypothetical protein
MRKGRFRPGTYHRKHSPEARAKISAANTGKKRSPEVRAKMSAAQKCRPPRKPKIERLVDRGRSQGYVTVDDVLAVYADPSKDVLRKAHKALVAAGIVYREGP